MVPMMPVLLVVALASGQAPMPTAAITAAKNAKTSVEAAQKKNSEALDPQPPQPPPPAAGQAAQPPAGAGAPQPTAQGGYTYDPDGRRDPFVSLMFRGGEVRPPGGVRPPGIAGLLIGEVAVKGVLKGKSGFIALLQASDNKTYIVHQGDRLMDGSVKSVAQDAVVFSQDVNDPLSLVKQREVRKTIRPETR